MSGLDAIRLEREGKIEQAASHYEEALAAGDRTLGVLLNLAILYWQATDPGFSSARGLDAGFMTRAGDRVPELLGEAERAYPGNTEVRFWQRYISWADLGEDFTPEECRNLLHAAPSVLAPAMYLFSQSQGRECRPQALELLERCREDGSTRARYVASVIEGVLKRSAWAEKHGRGGMT